MDFSNAGTTEPAGAGFRAHVTWYDKGSNRNIYGPSRKDEQVVRENLESMCAAASGMSREDGYAAMKAEADELKAGKPPKEVGYIDANGNAFRYRQRRVAGAPSHVPFRGFCSSSLVLVPL